MRSRRYDRPLFTLLVLIIAIGAVLFWRLGSSDFDAADVRGVILISIDTCRADYLGCYGDPRPITPHIDDLARQSILFEQVTASVPLTLPSHATMLTGTNPLCHGVRTNVGYRLRRAHATLAEVLKEHGYRTGAIVSSSVLEKKYGLNQGFDFTTGAGGYRTIFFSQEDSGVGHCDVAQGHG